MKKHFQEIVLETLDKKFGTFVEENQKKIKKYFDDTIISPELKIKHKKTNILYTVDSISSRDVVLRSPEGEKIKILHHDLEDKFDLA